MGTRSLAGVRKLGYAKASINTVTTTNLDFGTPNDLDLSGAIEHGERVMVVLTSTTAGTTDTTSWSIQDADDNAGAIGTPATAVTSVVAGDALAGGTGDRQAVVEVVVNPERPWLRVRTTRAAGTTDTAVVTALVLAVAPRL